MIHDWLEAIKDQGYAILPAVYGADSVQAILAELSQAIDAVQDESRAIRSRAGTVYAARNVADVYPAVRDLWRQPAIEGLLAEVLGREFGLVRVLYFDKPPSRTWSLPWHKDLTIAVRDNSLPSQRFRRPTHKAGVPHVEAPLDVLESMLTVRVHLDTVTDENGPLKVIAGSHRDGKRADAAESAARDGAISKEAAQSAIAHSSVESILVAAGDVLAMRPLVSHCSGASHPDTVRHRRILHFEFSGLPTLPDGYAWHEFHSWQ